MFPKFDGMKEYVQDKDEARCLECGDLIGPGRPDRKFCSARCRNRYNNRKTRSSRSVKIKVLSHLDRNYEILDGLLKYKITSMPKLELANMGFRPEYVTSFKKCRGYAVMCCFDISYRETPEKICRISRF